MKGIEILKQQIEDKEGVAPELKAALIANIGKMFDFQAYMLEKIDTDPEGLEMMFGFHMQEYMVNRMEELTVEYDERDEDMPESIVIDIMREGVLGYVTKHEYPDAENFTDAYIEMIDQIRVVFAPIDNEKNEDEK